MSQDINTPLCFHCSDPLDLDDRDLVTGETFCGANPSHDKHERYPADAEFIYQPVFASTLKIGDVIATDREGAERVEIFEEPKRRVNRYTREHFIIHTVRLVGNDYVEEMIFRSASTVFKRKFFHSASFPKRDTEL